MTDEVLLAEVRAMRSLLELMAEPAIAQRDARLRTELKKIVGTSPKQQLAALLMDGTKTQKQIVDKCGVHQGNLSTMVGKLDAAKLLTDGRKQPKLAITIPSNFFENSGQ